jgi:hypothetical protein
MTMRGITQKSGWREFLSAIQLRDGQHRGIANRSCPEVVGSFQFSERSQLKTEN